MPDLHTIDLAAIQKAVTLQVAREAVERALLAISEGKAVIPGGLSLETGAGEVHVKGAHLAGSAYLGFKFATGFPGNAELGLPADDGFSVALDARTGRPAALLLDRGWLTQMRTGAVSAVAAQLLARPDASLAAIIGTGEQAAFELVALREVRRLREIRVWNRSGDRARRFADAHTQPDSAVLAVDSVEQAVRNADVVITVTSSRRPLIDAAWLSPGTHVIAVGADTVGKRELQDSVLRAAGLLAADRLEVCREIGELQYLPGQQAAGRPPVELADLVAGRVAGRTSRDEITLVDQVGLGVYDAAMIDVVMDTLGGVQ